MFDLSKIRSTCKFRLGGYRRGTVPENAKRHKIGRFQSRQLPPKVDLRKYMTAVEDQVGNSCVANAFVGAYEYLAKRSLGDSADVSRLFVYYNARASHDAEDEDSGTEMNAAIESLIEYGACSEDLWPNDEDLIFDEPDEDAYDQAAQFKILEAEFIETDLEVWRHALAEGYPIAFALNTFDSFDEATRNRGRVPMPKRSDNVRETHGWHAMLCVGYSDKDRMFTVRNSWGSEWGDRGYCYIPYDYVLHSDYNGHDSWIIKTISDLDFSADVWEEEGSWFGGDDELLLTDFYVVTDDPEGFVKDLENLCEEYIDDEEDYYFDYEYSDSEDYEDEEEDIYELDILNFDLTLEDEDDRSEFLAELHSLCQEYAMDEDYDFSVDDESGDDEEDGEEDDEDDEDEDDDEEDYDEDGEDEDDEYDDEDDEDDEEDYDEDDEEE